MEAQVSTLVPFLLGGLIQAGLSVGFKHYAAAHGVALPTVALAMVTVLTQVPHLFGRRDWPAVIAPLAWLTWGLTLSEPMTLPAATAATVSILVHLAFFPRTLSFSPALISFLVSFTTVLTAVGLAATDVSTSLILVLIVPAAAWAFGVQRLQRTEERESPADAPSDEASGDEAAELEMAVAERTRELARLNERLEVSLERLAAVEAARTRTYRALGHELRDPLTSIQGLASVLAQALEGEDQEDVRLIGQKAETLLTLVDDLLELARAQDGSLAREAETLRLDEVAEDAVQGQRLLLADDVRFYLRLAPCSVVVDRHSAERIVANLVGNAVKYTRRGTIAVTTKVENGHAKLGVVDTGPGIPEEAMECLFEPFARVNGSQPREGFASSGLGLAVTKTLVEREGGDIAVESEVGRGTAFWVTLPAGDLLDVGGDSDG
jgi:signal transduction histidine kinase